MFLTLDYSQLEMRLIASESNETTMLQMFEDGKDVHDETAKLMFGDRFTSEDREICKKINFGTVYGISSYSLSNKFNIPERKAEDFISRHKRAYPKIYAWMGQQPDFIRKHGWIKSRLGQIRHFPGWAHAQENARWRMMRQAGNFPIQSLGAHLTNLAAWHLDEVLSTSFSSQVVFQQHDLIMVDLNPKDNPQEVQEYAEKVMTQKVPKKYAPFLQVDLPVKAQISRRWGAIE